MREGWEIKRLDEVLLKTETIDPTKQPSKTFEYIDVSSVNNSTLSIETTTLIKGKDAPSRARKLIRANDVIFATVRPTLKRIAIVPSKYDGQVCSTGYFVLRSKDFLLNKLIYYYLQTGTFNKKMESLQKGASYPAVTDSDIRNQYITYPKLLSEQKRIIDILDKAFAAIDKAKANVEQNLRNAKELFESYLKEVFESKGEDWEEKNIEDISTEIFAGGDLPKEYSLERSDKYNIPIYANAITDNGLYGYTNMSRVKRPALTISARGSGTGHTEIRVCPFLPIVRLIVIIPDSSKVRLGFLKHAIDNMDILHSGSAIPQLTVPMIKGYIVGLPSLEVQDIIIEKLDKLAFNLDKLRLLYGKKITDLEELKKSILQKAFSGELTNKPIPEHV